MASIKRVAAGAGGLSAAGAVLAALLVSHWEGMNLVAVHLPFDPPGVITVCGGITTYDLPKLRIGDRYTKPQCLQMLADAAIRYGAKIGKCIPDLAKLPPHRQAALTSFAVNLGPGKVCNTHIARDINAGRTDAACGAMVQYVSANHKFLQGLKNRRTDHMWGENPWCLRKD
jgi:lysozyme